MLIDNKALTSEFSWYQEAKLRSTVFMIFVRVLVNNH